MQSGHIHKLATAVRAENDCPGCVCTDLLAGGAYAWPAGQHPGRNPGLPRHRRRHPRSPLHRPGWAFFFTCGVLLATLWAFPQFSTSATGATHLTGRELVWRMITAAVLVFLLNRLEEYVE